MTNPKQAAQKLLQTFQTLYSHPHVYRQVNPIQFPRVNHKFYEFSQASLEKFGFQKLADIENVTVNSTLPEECRTFIRVAISSNQTTIAGIYHIPSKKGSWLIRLILFLNRSPKSYVIDLETEFSDGSFLVTSNAAGSAQIKHEISNLHQQIFPANTAIEILYNAHQKALQDRIKPGSVEPLIVQAVRDVENFQHRLHILKSSYRQSIGFLNSEDIDNVANGQYKQAATSIKQELEKIKTVE